MNLKKYFTSSSKLLLVALINLLLLSNLTTTEARSCSSRRNPCSAPAPDLHRSLNVIPQYRANLFNQVNEIFSMPMKWISLMEQQQRQLQNIYQDARYSYIPRYDISEDDAKMELVLDLPGIRLEDISLELQQHGQGQVLKVFGSRKYKHHGHWTKSEFDQIFTLDPAVLDVSQISAKMSNGVLIVSAPKLKHDAPEERVIPIKTIEDGAQSDGIKVRVVSSEQNDEDVADEQHSIQTIDESTTEEVKEVEVDGLEITEEEDV